MRGLVDVEEPGRYRFTHALVRDAIYDGVRAPARARAHAERGARARGPLRRALARPRRRARRALPTGRRRPRPLGLVLRPPRRRGGGRPLGARRGPPAVPRGRRPAGARPDRGRRRSARRYTSASAAPCSGPAGRSRPGRCSLRPRSRPCAGTMSGGGPGCCWRSPPKRLGVADPGHVDDDADRACGRAVLDAGRRPGTAARARAEVPWPSSTSTQPAARAGHALADRRIAVARPHDRGRHAPAACSWLAASALLRPDLLPRRAALDDELVELASRAGDGPPSPWRSPSGPLSGPSTAASTRPTPTCCGPASSPSGTPSRRCC